MQLRADEAMKAALAAADAPPPALAVFIEETMASIDVVCQDPKLDLRLRVLLIDDALLVLAALKKLLNAAQESRPERILDVVRQTNGLLSRYTRFVRAERAG